MEAMSAVMEQVVLALIKMILISTMEIGVTQLNVMHALKWVFQYSTLQAVIVQTNPNGKLLRAPPFTRPEPIIIISVLQWVDP